MQTVREHIMQDQFKLIDAGYTILDITVVHDGYFNSVNYFIKYTKES